MKNKITPLAGIVVGASSLFFAQAQAATTVTIGSTTLEMELINAAALDNTGSVTSTSTVSPFFENAHANTPLWSLANRAVGYNLGGIGGLTAGGNDSIEMWGSQDGPEVTTIVADLPAGEYAVYVAYLTQRTNNSFAQIDAGLNGAALQTYDYDGRDDTEQGTGTFDYTIAQIGTTAPGATSFSVTINDTQDGAGGVRTNFIGIGYINQTIPEPSTALFGLIALVGGLTRRKR